MTRGALPADLSDATEPAPQVVWMNLSKDCSRMFGLPGNAA
jgi:hypothetical protein